MNRIECLQNAIRVLVLERQAMRERDAGRGDLESNRLELADRQRQLSQALIEWHLCRADRDAA